MDTCHLFGGYSYVVFVFCGWYFIFSLELQFCIEGVVIFLINALSNGVVYAVIVLNCIVDQRRLWGI